MIFRLTSNCPIKTKLSSYFRLQGLYTRGTTKQCQSDASRETITKESFRMPDAEPSGVDKERWKLFFTKPGEVPCVRRSFLTGITSGIGVGVGYFFMSSNVRLSTNAGFGSYLLITVGTWFYCRYTIAQERIRQRQLKKALQDKVSTEGLKDQLQDV